MGVALTGEAASLSELGLLVSEGVSFPGLCGGEGIEAGGGKSATGLWVIGGTSSLAAGGELTGLFLMGGGRSMSGLGLFIMGGVSLPSRGGEPGGLLCGGGKSMTGLGLFLESGASTSGLGLLIIGGDSLAELPSGPEAAKGLLSLGGLSLTTLCIAGDVTGLFLPSGTSISGLGLLIIGGDSSPELSSSPEAVKGSLSPIELTGLLGKGWKLTGPLPCLGEHIGLLAGGEELLISIGEVKGLLASGNVATGLLASLGEPSGLLTAGGGLL